MGLVLLYTTGQDGTAGTGAGAGLLSRREHPCIGHYCCPLGTSYLWGFSQSVNVTTAEPLAQASAEENLLISMSLHCPPFPFSSPAPAHFLIYDQNHPVTKECNQDTL